MTVILQIEPLAVNEETAAAMIAEISTSTLYELGRTEPLLRPVQISKRRVGYLVDNLRKWVESRPVSEQLPPVNSGYGRAGNTTAEQPAMAQEQR